MSPGYTQDTSSSHSSDITGLWYTEDKEGIVEFYHCSEKLCGRLYWLKDENSANPSLDENNPDPEKQWRRLCGLDFIGGFREVRTGHYEDGWIYSPRHGRNFGAELTYQSPDRIKLRGYFLISVLGSSQIWTRAPADAPRCQ